MLIGVYNQLADFNTNFFNGCCPFVSGLELRPINNKTVGLTNNGVDSNCKGLLDNPNKLIGESSSFCCNPLSIQWQFC